MQKNMKKIKDATENICEIIKSDLWFYHDMTIDLYESGKIKQVSICSNPISISVAGITVGLCAGATLDIIDSANIVSGLTAVTRHYIVIYIVGASVQHSQDPTA